ncbi:MAG: sugar kinase [Desulfurococcaceae archaeon]
MMDICIYGNPTIDLIYHDNRFMGMRYGGGVYYSSIPFIHRGFRVTVYGVYTPQLLAHPVVKFMVQRQFSSTANVFELSYHGDERSLLVLERAPSLYPWNMHEHLCYVVINPVLGEIGVNMVKDLANRSTLIALDVQGFVRETIGHRVVNSFNPEVLDALEYVDIVHMDLQELISLARGEDTVGFMEKLTGKYREVLIVATNRVDPILMAINGRVRKLEVERDIIVPDKTGAGDYFLGSLLYHLAITNDMEEAVIKAHEDTSKWLYTRYMALKASSQPATV